MEQNVRCNWCGLCTPNWCWQQRQKNGTIVAKCQRCVDEGRTIPLIKSNEKEKNEQKVVQVFCSDNIAKFQTMKSALIKFNEKEKNEPTLVEYGGN